MKLPYLVFLGFIIFESMGRAAALPGKYLEFMTWKQAQESFKKYSVVMIPIGARTKEHGFHLPLNNDWLMAEYLAKRVAEKSSVLVLPTIPYGYYPAFLEYPGSVSIQKDTFRDMLADICRSICRHGPRKFYFLNTGISTNRPLEEAKNLLVKENIMIDYTNLKTAIPDVEKRVRKQEAGTHADEIETSMMLYIAPKIVNMKLAKKDIHPEKDSNKPGGLTRDPNATEGVYSPTGAWGNPTLASRQKGKIVVEALVDHIVLSLREFAKR